MADSILTKVVDCHYSWQVWEAIHKHFRTLLSTKARQLRSELRSLSKGSRTIEEFVCHVREITDSLASLGDSIPHHNLVEIVLEALLEEYDPIVAAINSKDVPCSLDEIESHLLAHETRLEKNKKILVPDSTSINLTQGPSQGSSPNSVDSSLVSQPITNPNFPLARIIMLRITLRIKDMVIEVAALAMAVVVLVAAVAVEDVCNVRYVIAPIMMLAYATIGTLILLLLVITLLGVHLHVVVFRISLVVTLHVLLLVLCLVVIHITLHKLKPSLLVLILTLTINGGTLIPACHIT